MDLMTALSAIPGIGPALPYLSVLVVLCALVIAPAIGTPPADASLLTRLAYQLVNVLGGNWGKAANHDDKAASAPVTTTANP